MRARFQHILYLFSQHGCADRQPAAKPFGSGENIRLNAVIHIPVKHTASAVSDLHFIADQKDIACAEQGGKILHKGLFQRNDAALTLNNLNHHGGSGVGVKQFLHAVKIPRRHMVESFGQRRKIPVENVLSGCRKRGNCPPVKAVYKRNDMVVFFSFFVLRVLARNFDGALVGFRSGVGKKDLAHAGFFAEHGSKYGTRFGIVKVGGVLQCAELRGDCRLPCVVGEAEGVHRDAGGKVNIFFFVFVINQRPFPVFEDYGKAAIGVGDVLAVQNLNIRLHYCSPFGSGEGILPVNIVPMPSLVSISIRIACGMRPSMMKTRLTPQRMALIQHSTLGIMPPLMTPSAISFGASAAWRGRFCRGESLQYRSWRSDFPRRVRPQFLPPQCRR